MNTMYNYDNYEPYRFEYLYMRIDSTRRINMFRTFSLLLSIILVMAFIISCSGGGNTVLAPGTEQDLSSAAIAGETVCLGLWQMTADKATNTIEITKLRSADNIVNVLGFMEPPAFTSLDLVWDDIEIDWESSTINVGVIFRHPFPDSAFTGFDVRGVVFGPNVNNADGLTIIPSPEFFDGVPFGFINGLLGAPSSSTDYTGLAGYKYFCDGIEYTETLSDFFSEGENLSNRGKFGAMQVCQRYYELDWNGANQDFFVYNYAVYANFHWAVGDPPYDLDDFEITTSNSAEAFCARVSNVDNNLFYSSGSGGGSISMDVEIWDWLGDISDVSIETLDGAITVTSGVFVGPGTTEYSYMYQFTDVPGSPLSSGDLDIIITAKDARTYGENWFLNLLPTDNIKYDEQIENYFLYKAEVTACPAPVVTGIEPPFGGIGEIINATITGSGFINGSSLAAALKMDGETDIVDSSPVFVNENSITAVFNLTGAATGMWDVVVTNGCGTPGTGEELFAIDPCGTMQPFTTTNYIMGDGYNMYTPHFLWPWTVSRTGTAMIIGRCLGDYFAGVGQAGTLPYEICAIDAGLNYLPDGGPHAVACSTSEELEGYGRYGTMACTSTNLIYYNVSGDHYVYEIQWNDATQTWGTYSHPKPQVPASGYFKKVKVDDDDNPIVLTSTNQLFHWNPTTTNWDSLTIPTIVGTDNIIVDDVDWNPVFDEYVFVARPDSIVNALNMYSMDTNGQVTLIEANIFAPNNTNPWEGGIYIDQDDPTCHFIVLGGEFFGGSADTPINRYSIFYDNKSAGNLSHSNYYAHCGRTPFAVWAHDGDTNRLITSGRNAWRLPVVDIPSDW
jgi:hypothetical protein